MQIIKPEVLAQILNIEIQHPGLFGKVVFTLASGGEPARELRESIEASYHALERRRQFEEREGAFARPQ